MRKRLFLTGTVFILAVISALMLVACNKGGPKPAPDKISRLTTSYFAGESEMFAVVVECGKREKQFIADGACRDVCEFCEIVITPLKSNDFKEIAFELVALGNTLSGTAMPKTNGEFGLDISMKFQPTLVTVTAGGKSSSVELANVLSDAIKCDEIVKIATAEFADRIAKETKNGVLAREIYIKLISGDRINYYYYVSFIGAGTDYWALLLEPSSGKVVSKR